MTKPRAAGRIHVLIVADIATLAAAAQAALQRDGMAVEIAATPAEATDLAERFRPEIIVVDLNLAENAGPPLVRHFSAMPGRGVLALADARTDGAGAHDVMPMPLAPHELVRRVRSLRWRTARPGSPPAGTLLLDHPSRAILREGAMPVALTAAEHLILTELLEARGALVSRDWLARIALKGAPPVGGGVDHLIAALRAKLAGLGVAGRTIQAVRGQGYVMADPAMFRPAAED